MTATALSLNATLTQAKADGVLTMQEACALDCLADTDAPLPAWLFSAVERLFLWCESGDSLPNQGETH